MKLCDLFPDQCAGEARRDLLVFNATDDSRQVRFGSVFFARPGTATSGLEYIHQAAEKGAQAIVIPEGTSDTALSLSDYQRSKLVIIRCADVPHVYAQMVARFSPVRPETIVGITGTNGKTSVASFVRDLWTHADRTSMSLGTLGLRSKGKLHTDVEAVLTTFDPATLHLMLEQIVSQHGVTHLAMEVSSHALDQRRTDGLSFQAAAFTNLSQDHLDYHGTIADYLKAKQRLFTDQLAPGAVSVVSCDDDHVVETANLLKANGRAVMTYSGRGATSDLRGISAKPHDQGQTLQTELFGKRRDFDIPLFGGFQLENVLCAIGLAISTGVDLDTAIEGVAGLDAVPGRAERVAVLENGASVYVDYAHTPAALETILKNLRPHLRNKGRLHVVFGCGGDRDRAKRAIMGKAAADGADVVYVTDDNPRSERPEVIRAQVLEGAADAVDAGDRESAIKTALENLEADDLLLIAGKGDEDYQVVSAAVPDKPKATKKMSFSDRDIVGQVLGRSAT